VRNNHVFLSLLILLPAVFLQLGCSNGLSSQASQYAQSSEEIPVCRQNFLYPVGVVLTGTAKFEKRGTELVTENVLVSGSLQPKLKNMVLGDPLPTALPIQNAEIAVYDADLKLVQCGQTNNLGELKNLDGTSDLIIPEKSESYLIRVLSRSNYNFSGPTDFLNVSVKKNIYKNEVHFIQNNFYSDGTSGVSTDLLALARQVSENMEITAGAFNILNNIQQSYAYIKSSTTLGTTNCLSTKLNVFWQAGFNPMQYQSPEADPQSLGNTSYFLSSTNELFISGGQLGDVSLSNTDHFDDFATVHELGHFVEKNCGQFTSPGGSHALIVRIDPRLAWSEGWANYFAAQVLNQRMSFLDPTMNSRLTAANETKGWTFFFNSAGFSDSVQSIGNGLGFMIDFKAAGTNPGEYTFAPYTGFSFDKVNPTLYKGEGHTREGAISRGLFKLTNDCGLYCISTAEKIPFSEIWQSFDRLTGMSQPALITPFLSSHTMLTNLKTIHGGSWIASHDSTVASEALHISAPSDFTVGPNIVWSGYGKKLVTGLSCSLAMEPRTDDPSLTGSNSDQRYSNHNFTVDLSSPSFAGQTGIKVTFTKLAGTDTDHDLLLFKPGYVYNDDYRCTLENVSGGCSGSWLAQRTITSDVALANRRSASPLTGYFKDLMGLNTLDPSQKYLLNIRSYTANRSIGASTAYTYVLRTIPGNQVLCPQ
jgi:hypothetical protein